MQHDFYPEILLPLEYTMAYICHSFWNELNSDLVCINNFVTGH